MKPARVYIISATRVYREALASRLAVHDRFVVVGTTGSVQTVQAEVGALWPDVVLIDMSMVEVSTLLAVAAGTRPKVISVGLPESDQDLLHCAEAGIVAFLPRDAPFEDLTSAIEAAMLGQVRLPVLIAARLIQRVAVLRDLRHAHMPDCDLTARELQVLGLVEEGLSNKEIASRLHIELSTVKNHVHNLLTKLGAHSRAQAAAHARREHVRIRQSG